MGSNDTKNVTPLGDGAFEIFERALALGGHEREAYVEQASAGNPLLRAELISLLQAHEEAEGFLEPARNDAGSSGPAPSGTKRAPQIPGDEIDRYRLIEPLGEGGFGSVYRAEQLQPVHREVAVKVIKLGMDTKQVIARFEAERQALAMMDHPGIARVFDAGSTRTGRPFFAMELVSGQPITTFCDAHRLDTRQRLHLFVQVCNAIQHAHQKGIIHRDIKPSNVLVSMQDGMPASKVIDFGIAKATGAGLANHTISTVNGQMIGTPAYMSPEQAGAHLADVDTRSDIYSLGALLYELLVGKTPFNTKRLLQANLDELGRIIREEEPSRPSTRLSELGAAESGIAMSRNSDTRRLKTILRGDLDWITMKCLEKDRSRRYETASALADDVQRFLDDEPVFARPPSVPYRLQKLARRHRAAVMAAASILLVLIATTGISISFAMRAEGQRQRADREAAEAKQRANETRQVAEFQSNMLSGLNAETLGRGIRSHMRETLQAALERQPVGEWPNRRQRTPLEVEEEVSKFEAAIVNIPTADVARRVLDEFLLAQASKTVEQSLAAQPLVQAQIRDSLARAYRALGLGVQAEEQCRLALDLRTRGAGPESVEVARNLNSLAWYLIDRGQFKEAEDACRKALAIQTRVHGPKHAEVASVQQILGISLRRQGKLEEAETHYQEALTIRRELLGNDHVDVADILNSFALFYQNKNDYDAAEGLFREALAIRRKQLGERDPIVAGSLNNLANLMVMQANRDEAKDLFLEALEMRREVLGTEHPDVAQALYNLGVFLNDGNEPAEAEPYFREAAAIWRKTLPEGHPGIAHGALGLGVVLKAQKKYDEAESSIRESIAIYRKALQGDDRNVVYAMNSLASLNADRGDYDEAESQFREIIAHYETRLPPRDQSISRVCLASMLVKRVGESSDSQRPLLPQLDEAETLLLAAYESFSTSAGAPKPMIVRQCLESLVELYKLRAQLESDDGILLLADEWQSKLQQFANDPSQIPK